MIKEFEKLTTEECKLLYKAPVLVSVLVSCAYNEVNVTMKNDAIKLAHLRTFTAAPLLLPYYQEVEKIFKEEFEKAVKMYFPFFLFPLKSIHQNFLREYLLYISNITSPSLIILPRE